MTEFKILNSQSWWCGSIKFIMCAWRPVWWGMSDGHTSPHRTSRTHNKRYAATSPRLTFKNFKLSHF